MGKWSRDEVEAAAALAARNLGFTELLPEQKEVITAFVEGQDVFVSLPTGFGKTLCFAALPGTFDRFRGDEQQSIVVAVSLLVALMEDQVAFYRERGLSAGCVPQDVDEKLVKDGRCQLVFVSPEMLLCNRQCRAMLHSELYRENLVGVVIDEAHCVKKWLATV